MKRVTKEILDREISKSEAQLLNSLLCAEISAVETYNKAIQNIKHPELIPTLEECRYSHALRIFRLRQRLKELGITPIENSGFLGQIAKLIEIGASMWGDQTAIAVLAGGEDFDLQEYKSSLKSLDEKSRKEVIDVILPAQEKTQKTMNAIYSTLQETEPSSKHHS